MNSAQDSVGIGLEQLLRFLSKLCTGIGENAGQEFIRILLRIRLGNHQRSSRSCLKGSILSKIQYYQSPRFNIINLEWNTQNSVKMLPCKLLSQQVWISIPPTIVLNLCPLFWENPAYDSIRQLVFWQISAWSKYFFSSMTRIQFHLSKSVVKQERNNSCNCNMYI